MKKNVIIFCVLAALAMLFASCKGGGGGDSKDSTTTTVDNAAGVWIDKDDLNNPSALVCTGLYFTSGKSYLVFTFDKSTYFYITDEYTGVKAGTYTANDNEVKITMDGTGGILTGTINGDIMTVTGFGDLKKCNATTIVGKTGQQFDDMFNPPNP